MATPYFLRDEYERRWSLVEAELKRRGYEAAVVWGRSGGTYERASDVLYLVNYYGNGSGQGLDTPLTNARAFAGVILRAGHEPALISDEAWPRKDLISTGDVDWSRDTVKSIGEALNANGVRGRVALVGTDFFPLKYWRQLSAATPNIKWVAEDDLVQSVRRIKSPAELECLREGGAIAARALNLLMEGLILGRPEREAAADAAREVVRCGGAIHMIPCSHGDMIEYFVRTPLPGYGPESAKPGDVVRGWVYGPMFQGYYLDPGRTAVAGRKPTPEQRELIETCAGIVDKLIARMKPGTDIAELAKYGDALAAESGADKDQAAEKFPLYGHGIGLFFEKPYISTSMGVPGQTIAAGMAFGVEHFMARKGVGSAGIEQNVIVTEAGTEVITPSPMLWH